MKKNVLKKNKRRKYTPRDRTNRRGLDTTLLNIYQSTLHKVFPYENMILTEHYESFAKKNDLTLVDCGDDYVIDNNKFYKIQEYRRKINYEDSYNVSFDNGHLLFL